MNKAIVIGAGIAGCSTAHALAKRGIAVTLIERHHAIAQEASGNPIAMLYPKFNQTSSVLSTISTLGFAHTLTLLKQLPAQKKIYDICGQIQLAFNAREQKKQSLLLRDLALNENVQLLSAREASEKANIALNAGGLYLPNAGWVNPTLFCNALIQPDLITNIVSTEVINIKKVDTNWQVSLEKSKLLQANIVVICNANDINQFDQCKHIPITAVRGQVNFFAANKISVKVKSIICTDHYLSPAVSGLHSLGASYMPNDLNLAVSTEDTRTNLKALERISPALSNSIDLSQVTGRVAQRSTTKDYTPLAGQIIDEHALTKTPPRYNDHPSNLPWLKGLYINTGHGSKGMITAPLCGELIANQVCNEPPITGKTVASKLHPSRFLLRSLGLKKIAQNLHSF